ncbi:3-hydroxyacyl-CoA dehydrogenase family protein [Thermoactinomyces mirandus]|uniref:3-hydroxybutyryl-CoA dehydrogenase n=1 Tax=Thermoactinomyces mirandus TaxID=2756294 RepID=A0A7W2AR32_9BACL|nr:3-hydroxyacyl-CoA dehydrogenase family protein [Thermoactinomyces mirandus]MBA4601897.1 3-hydroxybutyryl-CoA dehydrogenase [Thermoactinomyces mirandus]
MKNEVIVLGTGPLANRMGRFLEERGCQPVRADEKPRSDALALIDITAGMEGEKKTSLLKWEQNLSPDTPVFTSVLHLTATQIASWLQHPHRVVGFSPLFFEKWDRVEVSCPLQAEGDSRFENALSLLAKWGKKAEIVGDEPGLVFPRTLALLVNEAAYCLQEKTASREDIDLAMKKGTNFPQGPLKWADDVGIDQIVAILTGLHRELGDDRYRPASLLRKMYYARYWGKAAGRGFYEYGQMSDPATGEPR